MKVSGSVVAYFDSAEAGLQGDTVELLAVENNVARARQYCNAHKDYRDCRHQLPEHVPGLANIIFFREYDAVT